MEKASKSIENKPLRIVLVGAESTGKSSMVKALGEYFATSYSLEFLRDFSLKKYQKGEKLIYEDNLEIISGQMALDKIAENEAKGLYFADTDALQTLTYSQYYYDKHQDELEDILKYHSCDLYLFMEADIEWEADILRDGENVRKEIRDLLMRNLETRNLKFEIVRGEGDVRLLNAINIIKNNFNFTVN